MCTLKINENFSKVCKTRASFVTTTRTVTKSFKTRTGGWMAKRLKKKTKQNCENDEKESAAFPRKYQKLTSEQRYKIYKYKVTFVHNPQQTCTSHLWYRFILFSTFSHKLKKRAKTNVNMHTQAYFQCSDILNNNKCVHN